MSVNVVFNTDDNMGQNKSVLAKLLAQENITIVQKKMETAAFDLKTRTLYCPTWEAMDGDMYDLLMGHEVGHALDTPQEGWHDAIDKANKMGISKSILNIVEDARIEKRQKHRYPGLTRPMLRAYKQLNDRDFFGIKKLSDLSKLNLADRLNLHFKLGAFNAIPFSEEERQIVVEIDQAETWDEVVLISRKVQAIMKAQSLFDEDSINSLDDLIDAISNEEKQDLEDGSGSESDSDEYEEDEEEDDREAGGAGGQNGDDEDSDLDEETDDEDTTAGSANNADNAVNKPPKEKSALEQLRDKIGNEGEEPQSLTDQIFRARENELIVDNLEVIHLEFPEAALDNIIEPVMNTMANFSLYINQFSVTHYAERLNQQHNRFKKNNDKFIQQLVKQFMMKRNASQYARQLEARTGELDMNRLHKYKFTNDIFAKIKVVPKGKSHGLVVFIDMSGSMSSILGSTFEQMLILGTFCKRVNIPFDFYGFCDSTTSSKNCPSEYKFTSDNVTFGSKSFHLKHLLSSTFSPRLYKAAFDMLLNVSYHKNDYNNNINPPSQAGFDLNGTPLVQTIVAARTILERFKSKHKLDVVNAMYLTDGEGTDDPWVINEDRTSQRQFSAIHIGNRNKDGTIANKRIVKITDKKTKITMTCDSSNNERLSAQQIFTMMVQKITGCVNIGFYIGHVYDIKHRMKYALDTVDAKTRKDITESFRRNKFYSIANQGFAAYFNVSVRNDNINDSSYTIAATDTIDKKAVKKMTTEFSKNQTNKKSDRIFTSKLMEFLC